MSHALSISDCTTKFIFLISFGLSSLMIQYLCSPPWNTCVLLSPVTIMSKQFSPVWLSTTSRYAKMFSYVLSVSFNSIVKPMYLASSTGIVFSSPLIIIWSFKSLSLIISYVKGFLKSSPGANINELYLTSDPSSSLNLKNSLSNVLPITFISKDCFGKCLLSSVYCASMMYVPAVISLHCDVAIEIFLLYMFVISHSPLSIWFKLALPCVTVKSFWSLSHPSVVNVIFPDGSQISRTKSRAKHFSIVAPLVLNRYGVFSLGNLMFKLARFGTIVIEEVVFELTESAYCFIVVVILWTLFVATSSKKLHLHFKMSLAVLFVNDLTVQVLVLVSKVFPFPASYSTSCILLSLKSTLHFVSLILLFWPLMVHSYIHSSFCIASDGVILDVTRYNGNISTAFATAGTSL